jgi:hypothetical protein
MMDTGHLPAGRPSGGVALGRGGLPASRPGPAASPGQRGPFSGGPTRMERRLHETCRGACGESAPRHRPRSGPASWLVGAGRAAEARRNPPDSAGRLSDLWDALAWTAILSLARRAASAGWSAPPFLCPPESSRGAIHTSATARQVQVLTQVAARARPSKTSCGAPPRWLISRRMPVIKGTGCDSLAGTPPGPTGDRVRLR